MELLIKHDLQESVISNPQNTILTIILVPEKQYVLFKEALA